MQRRHVGDQQRDLLRAAGSDGEAPSFDRGEVLANTVHLNDGCAGGDQRAVEGHGVVKRDGAVEREFHHGSGAAADEEDAECAFGRVAAEGIQHGKSRGRARERGCVGIGMATREELNGCRQIGRTLSGCDEYALQVAGWRKRQPRQQGMEHGGGSLADGKNADPLQTIERNDVVRAQHQASASSVGVDVHDAAERSLDAAVCEHLVEDAACEFFQGCHAGNAPLAGLWCLGR